MTRKEYENEVREKIFDLKNEFNKKLLELHKELMAEFKEEEPSLDGWKVGDKYYFHDTLGKLHYDIIKANIAADEDDNRDIFRITHGYAKHTQKEAEFQIERDAVLYELSKYAEPEDRKWNGSNNHWYMYWSYTRDKIEFDFNFKEKHNDIYFASKEDAEKAIEAVGEQRIAKFYLGVD